MPGPFMTSPPRVILLGLVAFLGCQRTDHIAPFEPPSGLSPGAVASSRVQPSTRSAPPKPTCLVPLADPPAVDAEPAPECPKAPTAVAPLKRGTLKFLGGNQTSIEIELAFAPEEQQLGLMYRTELPAEAGMLFSWSNESIHTFWMRNTCIPLDMLFITADGTIAGILEQVPVLNDAPRSVPCPSAHVLEVNAGYCRKHGIRPGQRVRIKTS